jgi:hypothetical protein
MPFIFLTGDQMDGRKLFPVQENPYYGIFPGRTPQGQTVIAFAGYYDVVTVYFAADGKMLQHTTVPWTRPHVAPEEDTLESRAEAIDQEHDLIRAYLKANGVATIETVQVQRFWVPGEPIGITEYPSYLESVVEPEERQYTEVDPALLPPYESIMLTSEARPEELAKLREALERWRASGDFILHHGNDYYCHADGYIHSS